MTYLKSAFALSAASLFLASCNAAASGDREATSTPSPAAAEQDFTVTAIGTYDEPWAAAFIPGTPLLFITQKAGTARIFDTAADTPRLITVSGLPDVDYGGQGGLGDVAFLPSESAPRLDTRTIYLSWAEAGPGDTRGAAVGKGTLRCWVADECAVENLEVIWRQDPKVTGRGHYSHRLAISPDGQYLFVASGERQKKDPAQDTSNNLGSIVRLNLDGTPAAGNPLASEGGVSAQLWSWGHRNILGLEFDSQGRLWDLEHGPKGGDELNLVEPGTNYGWPIVSNGVNYDGSPIPDNDTRPEFEKPKVGWTPVIAPGSMVFYSGDMFPAWRDKLLIANLKTKSISEVSFDGTNAQETARYDFDNRLREIVQGPDGAVYVLEDGDNARLLKLTR